MAGATRVLRLESSEGKSGATGTLYVTNFRIAFVPARTSPTEVSGLNHTHGRDMCRIAEITNIFRFTY